MSIQSSERAAPHRRSTASGTTTTPASYPDGAALEELVSEALAGRAGAMNELVRGFKPLVRSVVRRCGVYGAEAEDIEQETWLRLTTNLARVREPAALPRWLAVTTTRLCTTMFDKRRRVQLRGDFSEDSVVAPDRWSDPADDVCRRDEVLRLHEAIDGLSERDQRLVRLLLAAASYREIGAAIAMPVGSIGPTRDRVLRKLAMTPQLASWAGPASVALRRAA